MKDEFEVLAVIPEKKSHAGRGVGASALGLAILATADIGGAVRTPSNGKRNPEQAYRQLCQRRGLRLRSFKDGDSIVMWAEKQGAS